MMRLSPDPELSDQNNLTGKPPGQRLKTLKDQWERCIEKITEAQNFYESANEARKERMYGWSAAVMHGSLIAGLFFIPVVALGAPILAVGAGAAGVVTLVGSGIYTECKVRNLPNTIKSCKEEAKEKFDQTLGKVPVEKLERLFTDNP